MHYVNDLIYDIGFHNGDDTAHYLKKGFSVIAVEANPLLAEEGTKKFSKAIAAGKLTLLNVGIADEEKILPFYRNHRLSVWSSFDKAQGTRNNTAYDVIDVRCITTRQLFQEYGIPFYLKVDIEGFDHYCLNDLPEQEPKPAYVSCEAVKIEWLTTLKEKGYSKFKIINQANRFKNMNLRLERRPLFAKYLHVSTGIRMRLEKFLPVTYPHGSSGPFAEDTPGEWKNYEETFMAYSTLLNDPMYRTHNHTSWFDFHAKLR